MTTPIDKARSCPFCGADGEVGRTMVWWVKCVDPDCGAEGPTSNTKAEAVKAWNAPSVAHDALAARLAEVEAALLNERGEGEPPSEGWERSRSAVPGGWIKRPAPGAPWIASVGMEHGTAHDGTAFRRWRWFVPTTSGEAPTAREAMRQADAALTPKEPHE